MPLEMLLALLSSLSSEAMKETCAMPLAPLSRAGVRTIWTNPDSRVGRPPT